MSGNRGSRRGRPPRGVSELSRSAREGALPIAPRIAVAGIIGAVLFGILILRLWALTVLGGAQYAERADRNQLRLLPREAPRGKILDRNGEPLVSNREVQQVVLNLQDVDVERLPSLLAALAPVLDTTPAKLQKQVDKAVPGQLEPVVLAGDVKGMNPIWYLQEHKGEFPGIDVKKSYQRSYPFNKTAAHILGQVGEVSENQLKTTHTNLKSGDRLGVSGVENTYDSFLRGTDGYDAVQVNAAGVREGIGRQLPAQPGNNLQLTIDLPLQRVADKALNEWVHKAASMPKGHDADGGAIVAMDVDSGELLVSASNPSFDENMFVDPLRYREVQRLYSKKNKAKPSMDRTLGGSWPPGSTYKTITALAAMDDKLITPSDTLECAGSMDIFGRKFKNHETGSRGWINLSQALETSCDTYFYQLGLSFYNQEPGPEELKKNPNAESSLQQWSRKFGLGESTGVDVPGEVPGMVPNAATKQELYSDPKRFQAWERNWLPGDSVNLSIGQGDLLVTPLQMTSVFATLANGGTKYTPHFGRSIRDASGKEEFSLPVKKPVDLGLDPVSHAGVKDGLYAVNNGANGTGRGVFGESFPVSTAGKSGTAEKGTTTDLAWYCGYAPVEKPEIAACAFIDKGGGGSAVAAPVVAAVFREYFSKKHQDLMARTARRDAAAAE
ncbi:MAG: Stage sporulation protein [Thermoleophilia bacterium]|nr:Stage sporulation protein [Thermoleophilia bacterium]